MSRSRVFIFLVLTVACAKECPPQSLDHTGPPVLISDNTNNYVLSRIGHFAELECCIQGTNKITWSKLNVPNGQWETLNSTNMDQDRVEFINNRQTLLFKGVDFQDEGAYMCYISMDGTDHPDINRKFSLDVVACDPLARGPYAIAPLPCENTVATIGEDLTLPCNGYFGCNDGDELRLVEWYVSDDHTEESHWLPATSVDSRYKVTVSESGNGTEMHANLTIRSVKLEDTRRSFKCLLASSQIVHGQSSIVVKLTSQSNDRFEMDTTTASFSLIAIAGGAITVVVLLFIFVGVTVLQARKTRKHVSKDIERKLSGETRLLNTKDTRNLVCDV